MDKISASFAVIAAENFHESSISHGVKWPWRVEYYSDLKDPTGLIIMVVIPCVCAVVGVVAARQIYKERFMK